MTITTDPTIPTKMNIFFPFLGISQKVIVMAREEATRSSNIIARTLDITDGAHVCMNFRVLQIPNVIGFVALLSVTPDMFEIASNHPNVSTA